MNKLEKNLLHPYIGYSEAKDEYQQNSIYKTLAVANVYSFYLLSFFMIISLIFDSINHKLTFGTFALFFVHQFNSYYIPNKLRKSGLNEIKVDGDINYSNAIKKLRKQMVIAGIQWGFSMFVLMEYIFPTLCGDPINIGLSEVLPWVCGGIFFGGTMYILGKSNLKKL